MTIELVFNETFDNVQAVVKEAMTSLGFAVNEEPMPAGNRVKMGMWTCEKGNKLLAMFLGFIFKLERVPVVMTAYQDGTTSLAVYDGGTTGGNIGSAVGGIAGSVADAAVKENAMSKRLTEIDTIVREKLGAKIAYQGKVKEGAMPLMV